MRAPLVSINVPCYRQLPFARQLVTAMLQQSWGDFELTLLDDGGSDEYRAYAAALGDPRVQYGRNGERLGAMRNIFQAIGQGRGRYTVAFHEDDLVDGDFLRAAVSILETDADCGFVACELREFCDAPPAAGSAERRLQYERYENGAAFLRAIFRGIEPMFGSVVYRRAAIDGLGSELERYGPLADRPFLLSILDHWSGVVIRQPALAWYRVHGEGDDRHGGMNATHILHLFERYRAAFPDRLSAEDESLFYGYSGYWLMTLYHLVPQSQQTSVREFLVRALRGRLYDLRFARRYGRRRLLSEVLFAG